MKLPEYIVEYEETNTRFKRVKAKNAIEAIKIVQGKLIDTIRATKKVFNFKNFKAKKY